MTDAIKAAAERVKRLRNGESFNAVYDTPTNDDTYSGEYLEARDCEVLADAYLAHASAELEGEGEIDAEWLESVGLYESSASLRYLKYYPLVGNLMIMADAKEGGGWRYRLFAGRQSLYEITTRAAVRSLLAVLGKGEG